ncbi:MAG: carboxypeptidase regulatory-like domain-containing protein, partial [Nocardioidaceae bacterium]
DTGGEGLYVGDGDSLTRVIGKGDVVETDLGTGQLGQHDDSPVFGGGPSINEGGDIAFTAGLHPEGDNQVEWGSGVFVAYAADSGEPVGTLSGSVTDANDDGPIAAATVTVRRPDGSIAAEATTGVGGTYQMSPPPGTYTVTASADRYLSQTVETAISSEQPATADLALATAVIKAKPGALEFSGGPGQVHEATLRIANTGSADLAWSLDSNKPWLSVETGSGDVRPGNVQALTVTADSTGLPPGSEQAAKLVIHGNAGRQRTVRVPVTLTITQQPCVGWMLGFC